MLLRREREFSPRVSAVRVGASAIVLLMFVAAGSLTPRWIALAQPAGPSFEVASIRPNQSGSEESVVNLADTGRLNVTNATLRTLIRNAYGIQNDQITGGPKWLDTDRYDIQAKTAEPIRGEQEESLMQNLLAERFGLKIHRETRDLPVFVLLLGKDGPKFQENTGANGSFRTSRGPGRVELAVTRATLAQLGGILGRQVGRVVQNKTGLNGYYDFRLEWNPEQTADSSIPSIFAALQEQLGLRLESAKGPVDILVIDHLEKPDAN
jgi:uncharacterized protein (TIGR03435 family)